jgi:hypothetical protein
MKLIKAIPRSILISNYPERIPDIHLIIISQKPIDSNDLATLAQPMNWENGFCKTKLVMYGVTECQWVEFPASQ